MEKSNTGKNVTPGIHLILKFFKHIKGILSHLTGIKDFQELRI